MFCNIFIEQSCSRNKVLIYYSEDMITKEQKRYINNLIERINATDIENRAMDLVLQDFLDKQKEYEERLSKLNEMLARVESLKTSIKDETKKRKSAERKVADLETRLKCTELNK